MRGPIFSMLVSYLHSTSPFPSNRNIGKYPIASLSAGRNWSSLANPRLSPIKQQGQKANICRLRSLGSFQTWPAVSCVNGAYRMYLYCHSKFEICISHMTPCSIYRKTEKMGIIYPYKTGYHLLILPVSLSGPLSCSANPWPCVCTSDALGDKYGTWSTYLRWNRRKLVSAWRWKGHMQKNPLEKKEFTNPPFWNEIFMGSNCSVNPNIAFYLVNRSNLSDICTVGSSQKRWKSTH